MTEQANTSENCRSASRPDSLDIGMMSLASAFMVFVTWGTEHRIALAAFLAFVLISFGSIVVREVSRLSEQASVDGRFRSTSAETSTGSGFGQPVEAA